MRLPSISVPILRPLVWLGNTIRNIRSFPQGAQKLLGDELQLLQFGGMPKNAKPFKGIGSGVIEIALRYDKDAYRTVVAVSWARHSMSCTRFKRNQSGVSPDVELIRKRYQAATELAKPEN